VNYTGSMSVKLFVVDINTRCGVDWRLDGLRRGNAGLIPEADAIAHKFVKAEDKLELIQKMKKIPSAEFYVTLMERGVDKGVEQLRKDRTAIKRNLKEKKGSTKSLDVIKTRYSILNSVLFRPKPKPTPSDRTLI
jgi:hypothetical protein